MKKIKANKWNKYYFPYLEFLPEGRKHTYAIKLKVNL